MDQAKDQRKVPMYSIISHSLDEMRAFKAHTDLCHFCEESWMSHCVRSAEQCRGLCRRATRAFHVEAGQGRWRNWQTAPVSETLVRSSLAQCTWPAIRTQATTSPIEKHVSCATLAALRETPDCHFLHPRRFRFDLAVRCSSPKRLSDASLRLRSGDQRQARRPGSRAHCAAEIALGVPDRLFRFRALLLAHGCCRPDWTCLHPRIRTLALSKKVCNHNLSPQTQLADWQIQSAACRKTSSTPGPTSRSLPPSHVASSAIIDTL